MTLIAIILLTSVIYLTTIIAHATVNEKDLKLELVQLLLRHGARTPNNVKLNIANFTLAPMYAPLGLGQLTKGGKQQEYELGKFLRNRYDSFLGPTYKPADVYAYSSGSTRTQMSLQLVLAGLFPPSDSTIWNSRLKWSPIPYEYVPVKSDVLLESYKTDTFRGYVSQALDTDEFKRRLAEYSDFTKYVHDRTIVNNEDPFWATHATFDILIANEFMKMALPDWYIPEVREKLFKVEEILRDLFVATPRMRKYGVGALIKTFVENLNLKGRVVNPKKIYFYSGHDANIAMFTRAHNIREFLCPDFGSALIFEKWRDYRDRIYVRLLAWDGAGKVMTLKLNNNEFCPIDGYMKIVENIIPSEREINEISRSMKLNK